MGDRREHQQAQSEYAEVGKKLFRRMLQVGGLWPHSPALSLLASAESSGWCDAWGPTRCLASPGRKGVSPQAKGRACRAPWAVVGRGRSEPCWGRFRRLCNLTQPARPRGSDERGALLPKLISRAPPSPPPAPPPPPAGPRLGFVYLCKVARGGGRGVWGRPIPVAPVLGSRCPLK